MVMHYQHQHATTPDSQRGHALVGEPASNHATAVQNSISSTEVAISPHSTAPYKNPRDGRCIANGDTCNGYVSKKGAPYCTGHAVSMGLIDRSYKRHETGEDE